MKSGFTKIKATSLSVVKKSLTTEPSGNTGELPPGYSLFQEIKDYGWCWENQEAVSTPMTKEEAIASAWKNYRDSIATASRHLDENLPPGYILVGPLHNDWWWECGEEKGTRYEYLLPVYEEAHRHYLESKQERGKGDGSQ
jgi:hypothetical protein